MTHMCVSPTAVRREARDPEDLTFQNLRKCTILNRTRVQLLACLLQYCSLSRGQMQIGSRYTLFYFWDALVSVSSP